MSSRIRLNSLSGGGFKDQMTFAIGYSAFRPCRLNQRDERDKLTVIFERCFEFVFSEKIGAYMCSDFPHLIRISFS